MFSLPLPKAASIEDSKIQELCEQVVPGSQATYLAVEPIRGAVDNECYGNVAKAIELYGGTTQLGWKIWETLPGVMAEAEFHAVWIDKEGTMHEVSPAPMFGMNRILFLPDNSRQYSGKQIDNIRIPLKDDALIREFIASSESFYKATNRGELADYHGELVLTRGMQAINARKKELFIQILQNFYI